MVIAMTTAATSQAAAIQTPPSTSQITLRSKDIVVIPSTPAIAALQLIWGLPPAIAPCPPRSGPGADLSFPAARRGKELFEDVRRSFQIGGSDYARRARDGRREHYPGLDAAARYR